MPALSNQVLWSKLWAGLPDGTRALSEPPDVRPLRIDVPDLGTLRIYVWTLTEDHSKPGARPPGEFKIQLIVPGQPTGEYGSLDFSGHPAALLGYSPDFGVFVGWEARLYSHFSYSANVQVREDLLVQARDEGWAVAPPRTSQGHDEVRVAFAPSQLQRFLRLSLEADRRSLEGKRREAVFLSATPKVSVEAVPGKDDELDQFIAKVRAWITATRWARDPQFAKDVKREYEYACAVCTAQLGIVEAAHIIPASEPEGVDAIWNGLALCPNHHKLFDSRLFVIDPDLVIHIDQQRIDFLVETNRESGLAYLKPFAEETVLPPMFWKESARYRKRLQESLEWVVHMAGMASG